MRFGMGIPDSVQPWTPRALGSALCLWLDASSGVTSSGGKVSAWADRSRYGNGAAQATGAAQPAIVTGALNGKPIVRFDGAATFLSIANAASLQPRTNDWTVVFVGKRGGTNAGTSPGLLSSRPWSTFPEAGWAVANAAASGQLRWMLADGSTGQNIAAASGSGAAWSNTAFESWCMQTDRTANTLTFYRNGAFLNQRTGAVSGLTLPDGSHDIAQASGVYVGANQNGTDFLGADIAELLVVRGTLSAAERTRLLSYLRFKWALY